MAKKINNDHVDKFYEYDINTPTRTIYIGSVSLDANGDETGTNCMMAERVIKALHLLEAASSQPITILMNNPGGDVAHGMAIYDAIKACNSHTTIISYGNVCSMAAYILQAAKDRVLAPNSVFMFHEGYDTYSTNHPKIIDNWRDFYKNKYGKVLNSILLNAINNKRAADNKKEMTEKEFEKYNNFDTILTAKEAVDWGFADRILGD